MEIIAPWLTLDGLRIIWKREQNRMVNLFLNKRILLGVTVPLPPIKPWKLHPA